MFGACRFCHTILRTDDDTILDAGRAVRTVHRFALVVAAHVRECKTFQLLMPVILATTKATEELGLIQQVISDDPLLQHAKLALCSFVNGAVTGDIFKGELRPPPTTNGGNDVEPTRTDSVVAPPPATPLQGTVIR